MLILAAGFGALYLFFRRRDRRMLRNGVFLVGALGCGLLGILEIFSRVVPGFGLVSLALVLLLPASVVVLCWFLIANGITMLRREGRRLGNMLSLLAGLAIPILPVVAVLLVGTANPYLVTLAVLLFLLTGYVSVAFVIFLSYALAYGRMTHREHPAALVVLGSRLIGGQVPPLLRARLDRALEVYQDTEPKPLLIPSGGQGPDESRAEGAAMAEYLREQGVPAQDVIAETEAVSTAQNLRFAQQIQDDAGRSGALLAVTNNYHVLRAALLARKAGLRAEVTGSKTARYYVPSAFLREFIAVMRGHLFLHAVLFLPFLAFAGLVLMAALAQG
ncbi:YdcF family protein [Nesterenkonia xinjiangensis]|nr:YdcF family protein [Nesterenkonia xinjiangensis]